jgi:hypothetical protein
MAVGIRTFHLYRVEDESGVSGTGKVAEGVEFTTGRCAVNWLTEFGCCSVYDNIKAVEAVHGHGGKTRIVFDDEVEDRAA